MQQSRLISFFLAFFAFSLFAFASPVGKDVAVARAADPLTVILNILVDLKAKIDVNIAALVKLNVNANISVVVSQIVVAINVAIKALVSVGAVVDLSDTDKISVIASVFAQILVSIVTSVSVFAKVFANVTAVVTLDVALQALLIHLNLSFAGILVIIAPLVVKVKGSISLTLPLVLALLKL